MGVALPLTLPNNTANALGAGLYMVQFKVGESYFSSLKSILSGSGAHPASY